MRTTLYLSTVILAALLVAPQALAHGSQFRGPRFVSPPWLRCDCARVECEHCGNDELRRLPGGTRIRANTRTLATWDDLVEVETRVRFTTRLSSGSVEAHTLVRHAPLFAASAGSVEIGEEKLEGRLVASVAARRDYLWERRRQRDPLLVLRIDAAKVRLRVFPISRETPTFAVVRGYALSDDVDRKGMRVYRTGARFLLITPRGDVPKGLEPDFVDPGGDRALFFLDERAARMRFGEAVAKAREVPCVGALECAVRNHGKDAVTKHAALVALPPGGGAPKNLVVSEKAPDPVPLPPPGAPPPPPPTRHPDAPPGPTGPDTQPPAEPSPATSTGS